MEGNEHGDIGPPRWAHRFFRWYCHPKLLKYIEGDLLEMYEETKSSNGKYRADLEFIVDVILLCRPGIIRPAEGHEKVNTFGMYKSYLKIGWRNLWKSKAYSFINIGGLALGLCVTMLIGLWVYDEVSFDRQNPNYERVAQVLQHVEGNGTRDTWWNMPFPMAEELRQHYGSDFKRIAQVLGWYEHMVTYRDKVWKQSGMFIENDGPAIIGTEIEIGTMDFTNPASVLISTSMAQSLFASSDPINQSVVIDNLPPVNVVGVYKDFQTNSRFSGLNFIAPLSFLYNNDPGLRNMEEPWRPNFATLFVELNENNIDFAGLSIKIKDAKMRNLNEHLAQQKPELFLHPMKDWHLRSEFRNGENVGGAIQNVWIFGSIGIFVLLLACINFMNLSTARYERRAKEVGIRKAIGSVRSQLVIQFLGESFVTVLLSFIAAVALTQVALPFFNVLADKNVSIPWNEPVFWAACLSFISLTAVIAGSYPAFYLSSFKTVKALKGTYKVGRMATLPRKILVTLQFTVSVILIIGTIIIYEQIQFVANRPIGYSRARLIDIPLRNSEIHKHFDAITAELKQLGAVENMAEAGNSPTRIWYTTSGLQWPGKDEKVFNDFGVSYGTAEYGGVIEWKIKEGRDFSREFSTDTSALILNEAAIQFMNLKNPIGQQVTWFGQPYTIIGVVENLIMESPYTAVRPIIYGFLTTPGDLAIAKLNANFSAQESISKIEQVFKKYNPTHPFEYSFIDEDYARKFGNEQKMGKLVSTFSALAITISCLGLFGLASFVAQQRTKEIGVRKVMGASVFNVWKMLSQDFVALVVLAVLIATPIAFYTMDRWLDKYPFHTTIHGWEFAAAGMGAMLITLLTVSYQSIKAGMANPVRSLRSE